ncbi:Clan CA, family C19, ubiquitin hydrolase-like cysteine peptidase [Tritrichomonas foetus]|uniref:Clan CA, family C19, ubiquitin hydrolase-like cysteine peptidase n=1 Tax=Tritrichomonas foetus TaxID=1144522 RepID=A0A1J4J8H6_9EUKA|nr:Clan CA, family C19, ubiquitin hydrolase-like cysteine peptidase [Tritrichomonas foetus]|eukprot:OHS93701.1 Clan CA, family C19, ubiquitin hydrolase-like cysteine peptidase [Tritrichomonas foetus]
MKPKSNHFHESAKYIKLFKESEHEKSNFIQVQRLLWEKSFFPQRFPACSSFLCSTCNSKSRNLSFCLQCGRVYCLNHFCDHNCPTTFGVDILTHQLFFYEKENGRRFVFDSSIDYLIISAKLAIIDGIPFQAKIEPSSSIFPTRHTPMPLQNCGNTCWMNSLLQCLISNPLLQKWFLSESINITEIDCPEAAVHNHLCRLFLAQLGESTFSITDYLFSVWTMSPIFATSNQCDSHEFFLDLRSKLDDFYQKKFESQVFSSIFNCQLKVIESCENCDDTRTFIENSSDLILNIENCSSLSEALSNYLLGSSPRTCNNCHKQCKRQYFFNTLPSTLTIALVRASYSERSVKNVQLTDELSLDNFIDLDKKKELGDSLYSLVGMVVRPGSGEMGHYWANVKKNGIWYRCDDNSVSTVDMNSAFRDDACLLFYIRKGFVYT